MISKTIGFRATLFSDTPSWQIKGIPWPCFANSSEGSLVAKKLPAASMLVTSIVFSKTKSPWSTSLIWHIWHIWLKKNPHPPHPPALHSDHLDLRFGPSSNAAMVSWGRMLSLNFSIAIKCCQYCESWRSVFANFASAVSLLTTNRFKQKYRMLNALSDSSDSLPRDEPRPAQWPRWGLRLPALGDTGRKSNVSRCPQMFQDVSRCPKHSKAFPTTVIMVSSAHSKTAMSHHVTPLRMRPCHQEVPSSCRQYVHNLSLTWGVLQFSFWSTKRC